MNFLAHIYLSPPNDFIKMGNFFADAIKGKKYLDYPKDIQTGVLLHRAIDSFTDAHPIHKQSRKRLNKRYGHYNSVIIDLFYDHFLAKNWADYSTVPLSKYAKEFYELLHNNYDLLPDKTKEMLPYIERYDWLYNYQFIEGMENVLQGMNRRTQFKSQMHLSIEDLKLHNDAFENDFVLFFKELMDFSAKKILELEDNTSY